MNTQAQIVILSTLASLLTLGCAEGPEAPAAVERAAASTPILISASPTNPGSVYDYAKAEPDPVLRAPKSQPEMLVQDEPHAIEPGDDTFDDLAVPDLKSAEGITIRRMLTTPDVEHREPRAASSIFSHGETKVFAFLEVENVSDDPKTLTVFFIAPSGKVTGGVELEVPASMPRWRTWAFTRFIDEVGPWRVEVRSPTGTLLGSLPFEVAEGC
ncbi:MAG: DUF2914 domain-containing protein [Polyangiales bacterium]